MPSLFIPAASPYSTDIRPLTSLRFIACLMVILFHFYQIHPNPGPVIRFFSGGYLWVDFFFILSGFILSHAYAEDLRTRHISVKFYYLKRLARIYPVHLATLLIFAGIPFLFPALDLIRHENDGITTFFLNIFLLHAWGFSPGASFNAPSWSISAEWFAYLLFPVILVQSSFLKKPAAFLGVAILLLGVFWLAGLTMFGRALTDLSWNGGILRIFPAFVFGMALYRFGCRYSFRLSRCFAFPGAMLVALLAAAFSFPPFLCTLLFGFLIIVSAEQSRQGHKTLLERPLAVWLGEISYSLYMVHIISITATMTCLRPMLEGHLKPDLLVPVMYGWAILASIFAAVMLYYLVEKPGRRAITAIAFRIGKKS